MENWADLRGRVTAAGPSTAEGREGWTTVTLDVHAADDVPGAHNLLREAAGGPLEIDVPPGHEGPRSVGAHVVVRASRKSPFVVIAHPDHIALAPPASPDDGEQPEP
jgi:hypothetical protein